MSWTTFPSSTRGDHNGVVVCGCPYRAGARRRHIAASRHDGARTRPHAGVESAISPVRRIPGPGGGRRLPLARVRRHGRAALVLRRPRFTADRRGAALRARLFRRPPSREGRQRERYPILDPDELRLAASREADGASARGTFALPGGRRSHAAVRQARGGRVPLPPDSGAAVNGPAGRGITGRLHGGGSAQRPLRQMRPGIGGASAGDGPSARTAGSPATRRPRSAVPARATRASSAGNASGNGSGDLATACR